MREYKFRGKRKDNGKWIYGSLISWPDGEMEIADIRYDDSGNKYMVIPETVGQFTGLKDKNGKEIYEGDRLKRTQQIDGNFIDKIIERYEVTYNSSIAAFEYKPIDGKEYKQYTIRPFGGDEIEIIGNIHDVNPAVKDSVNIDMNILDPKEGQAEQEQNAQESASQDQAMEATQDSEEGGTEG